MLILSFTLAACGGGTAPTLRPEPDMDPSGVATAVVPPRTPTALPAQAIPEDMRGIVAAAAMDLARRQDVPVEQIDLVDVQPTEWPDAGLGCPAEGNEYAQVVTPGYEVKLDVQGTLYSYHTDQGNFFVLCLEDGPDSLPVIPILPDEEIMDGIPWMPVDPVATIDPEDSIADPDPVK